jgi:hypothetical protein
MMPASSAITDLTTRSGSGTVATLAAVDRRRAFSVLDEGMRTTDGARNAGVSIREP